MKEVGKKLGVASAAEEAVLKKKERITVVESNRARNLGTTSPSDFCPSWKTFIYMSSVLVT